MTAKRHVTMSEATGLKTMLAEAKFSFFTGYRQH
jgi:hypothetical protein